MSPASLTTLLLDVMGAPIRLEFAGEGAATVSALATAAWDRCHADAVPAPGTEVSTVRVVLDSDPEVIADAWAAGHVGGTTERAVLDSLTARLVQDGLEAIIGDRLLLHACALADPESGATVVLVAPSGTGKTTASAALATTFGYVTDETAVVERDGSMRPFPKPLSLLVDGVRPKRQVSPSELDMLPSPEAPWAARFAYLQRDPGVQGVRVERVPPVEALALLAEQTSSLHLLEQPLTTLAEMLESRGGLHRLVYAEAEDLLPVLSQWTREAERPGEGGTPTAAADPAEQRDDAFYPSSLAAVVPDFADDDGPRLRRLPVVDEMVGDEGMAVMVPGQVLALSALATIVLWAVGEAGAEGLAVSSLEKYMAGEVPPPEGVAVAEALVPLVDDLVGRHLLERL